MDKAIAGEVHADAGHVRNAPDHIDEGAYDHRRLAED